MWQSTVDGGKTTRKHTDASENNPRWWIKSLNPLEPDTPNKRYIFFLSFFLMEEFIKLKIIVFI